MSNIIDFTTSSNIVLYRGEDGCEIGNEDNDYQYIDKCEVDTGNKARNTRKIIDDRIEWLNKLINIKCIRGCETFDVPMENVELRKRVLYTICGCGDGVSFTPDKLTAMHYGAKCGKLWRKPRKCFSLSQNRYYHKVSSHVSTCYIPSNIDMYYIEPATINSDSLLQHAIEYKLWMNNIGHTSKLNIQLQHSLFSRFMRSVACGNSQKIYRSFLDKERICFIDTGKRICIPKYEQCIVYHKAN